MDYPEAGPVDLGIEGLVDLVVLGTGGSAVVYRARQIAFDRQVAIKVITAPVEDIDARDRFQRELMLSGRLSGHPNIARVYEAGFTRTGQPYLVMEYYGGGTLRNLCEAHGPQLVGYALDVGVKLCGAAATAESTGILHRDIKPENVLLDQFGEPHLADFGISGLAADADHLTTAFTARYAAPEILAPEPVYSAKGDQYALALTLAFLLAGQAPDLSIRQGDFTSLSGTPGPAIEVLATALSDNPADRYANFEAMGSALQSAQRRLSEPATRLLVLPIDGPLPEARTPPVPFDLADATSIRTPNVGQPGATAGGGTSASGSGPGGRANSEQAAPEFDDDLTRLRASQAQRADEEPHHRSTPRIVLTLTAVVIAALVLGGVASVLLKGGPESSSTDQSAPPLAVPGAASAPADVTITVDNPSELTVTWFDTNGGGVPYAGYALTEGQTPGEHPLDFATEKGATTATMPGLPSGQRHCVQVFPIVPEQTAEQRNDSTATVCTP